MRAGSFKPVCRKGHPRTPETVASGSACRICKRIKNCESKRRCRAAARRDPDILRRAWETRRANGTQRSGGVHGQSKPGSRDAIVARLSTDALELLVEWQKERLIGAM